MNNEGVSVYIGGKITKDFDSVNYMVGYDMYVPEGKTHDEIEDELTQKLTKLVEKRIKELS